VIIELREGESVEITFAETDGRITVGFSPHAVFVTSDLPDTQGREGTIYEEVFGTYPPGCEPKDKTPVEEHGEPLEKACGAFSVHSKYKRDGQPLPTCNLIAGHAGKHRNKFGETWENVGVNGKAPRCGENWGLCQLPKGHGGDHCPRPKERNRCGVKHGLGGSDLGCSLEHGHDGPHYTTVSGSEAVELMRCRETNDAGHACVLPAGHSTKHIDGENWQWGPGTVIEPETEEDERNGRIDMG
jgi:hypothetical protein